MRTLKTAYVLNICLFLLEVFAICWMMSGIHTGLLSASRLVALKYFTVDSNILMGIIAFIVAIDQRKVLKGTKSEVSASTYILKLVGTVGVTLTMIITVFFLVPTTAAVYGPFAMFYNSNFLLHLLNPLFSIMTFVCFEKTNQIDFIYTFAGIIPMLIYAVYYVAAALSHTQNGMIAKGYDWYGFFFAGTRSVVIVVPIIVLLTYGISAVLWKWNGKGML